MKFICKWAGKNWQNIMTRHMLQMIWKYNWLVFTMTMVYVHWCFTCMKFHMYSKLNFNVTVIYRKIYLIWIRRVLKSTVTSQLYNQNQDLNRCDLEILKIFCHFLRLLMIFLLSLIHIFQDVFYIDIFLWNKHCKIYTLEDLRRIF